MKLLQHTVCCIPPVIMSYCMLTSGLSPSCICPVQFELTDQEYELLTDYGTEDLADRRPICARNLWKRLPGGTTACEFHGEMGCSKCFDFKEQVLRHKGVDLALLQPAAMSPAAVAGTVTSTAAAQPAPNAADSSTQVPGQPTAATAEAGASTSISTTKCWGCGVASSPVVKLRKCAACKRARYCSKGCQHQHYPEHKAQCKQWRDE